MQVLIIANGKFKVADVIKYQKKGYYLIACDGAANKLKQLDIIFDLVVGDMDSISPQTLQFAKDNCKYHHKKSQDDTDLEFAINIAQEFASKIVIIGALSTDRLDHMLMNILLLKKVYNENIPTLMRDTKQMLVFVKDQSIRFACKNNDPIGFFGFPQAVVTCKSNSKKFLNALEWKLDNYALDFEKNTSSSNIIRSESFTAQIKGECVIAFPKNAQYYFVSNVSNENKSHK